jgi:hypothetical protein
VHAAFMQMCNCGLGNRGLRPAYENEKSVTSYCLVPKINTCITRYSMNIEFEFLVFEIWRYQCLFSY